MAAQWEVPGLGEMMARAYDVREGTLDPAAVARRIEALRPYVNAIVDLAGIRTDETIADAGCGAASLSLALALRAPKARIGGIDVSPKAVDAAKAAAAALRIPAAFRTGVVEDLPAFAPGASMVLGSFVFNLVPDKPAFMEAVARTVAPAGRIIVVDAFVDPAIPDAESRAGGPGPVMPQTFQQMALAAGLRVGANRDLTDIVHELERQGVWPWAEVVRAGLLILGWRLVKG